MLGRACEKGGGGEPRVCQATACESSKHYSRRVLPERSCEAASPAEFPTEAARRRLRGGLLAIC
eukprot:11210613-Alexandrium_andersonii.AAC.1